MEAFFVVVIALVMLAVGVAALLAARRLGVLTEAGPLDDELASVDDPDAPTQKILLRKRKDS